MGAQSEHWAQPAVVLTYQWAPVRQPRRAFASPSLKLHPKLVLMSGRAVALSSQPTNSIMVKILSYRCHRSTGDLLVTLFLSAVAIGIDTERFVLFHTLQQPRPIKFAVHFVIVSRAHADGQMDHFQCDTWEVLREGGELARHGSRVVLTVGPNPGRFRCRFEPRQRAKSHPNHHRANARAHRTVGLAEL